MLSLDHLALACTDLEAGARQLEEKLGLPLAAGGEHPLMGTHNRLLSLGPEEYLELIAINPAAPAPSRPRWFDLDAFSGPMRLQAWIAKTDDLEGALALAPSGSGEVTALARGDLRWKMAIPPSGKLPFGASSPALIEWEGLAHPAARLPDHGARLLGLTLYHPEPSALRLALAPLISDPRIAYVQGPASLSARISTQKGEITL